MNQDELQVYAEECAEHTMRTVLKDFFALIDTLDHWPNSIEGVDDDDLCFLYEEALQAIIDDFGDVL